MKLKYGMPFVLAALLLNITIEMRAQDDDESLPLKKTKLMTGLYVGSYFANKYSASTYNGYGFDIEGNQNTFENSFMHQKIINEYGGGYGQYDQVADAIGVDQKQWTFNESDMPTNMRYTPSIMVGFNCRIPVEKKSAFLININGSKLNVEGNFTITKIRPQGTNPAFNNNIVVCGIRGAEQRLLMQVGFQQLFGSDEKFNFFGEIGLNGTLAKYDRNYIFINELQIDLTYYVNQTLYPAPGPTRKPVGFGVGAFAGLGTNFEINPKFAVQFLYTLSHEKVNIGNNPTLKLQHAIGLRVYFKLK